MEITFRMYCRSVDTSEWYITHLGLTLQDNAVDKINYVYHKSECTLPQKPKKIATTLELDQTFLFS